MADRRRRDWRRGFASVSAPLGDVEGAEAAIEAVEDSDEAIEAVDVQEAVEPIGEAATETVEDAVDLMTGESSEEIDAFENEVSALTDDVEIGEEVSESVSAPEVDENAADAFEDELAALTDDVEIGEEVSASVSAPVGDVGDSDVAIEAVDIQEAVEPIGEAATETVEDAVDLMASESSEEIDAFEDEVSALTDDVEIGEEVSEASQRQRLMRMPPTPLKILLI